MAKTKALISFAVTAKLICVFVFAYAKSRFSHDAAHDIDAHMSHFMSKLVCVVLFFFKVAFSATETSLTPEI